MRKAWWHGGLIEVHPLSCTAAPVAQVIHVPAGPATTTAPALGASAAVWVAERVTTARSHHQHPRLHLHSPHLLHLVSAALLCVYCKAVCNCTSVCCTFECTCIALCRKKAYTTQWAYWWCFPAVAASTAVATLCKAYCADP
jgi:hypothetical protein